MRNLLPMIAIQSAGFKTQRLMLSGTQAQVSSGGCRGNEMPPLGPRPLHVRSLIDADLRPLQTLCNCSGWAHIVLGEAGPKKGRHVPPHPGPLPRERGNSRQSADGTNGSWINDCRPSLFPLPGERVRVRGNGTSLRIRKFPAPSRAQVRGRLKATTVLSSFNQSQPLAPPPRARQGQSSLIKPNQT
jgi:hypothetical protein